VSEGGTRMKATRESSDLEIREIRRRKYESILDKTKREERSHSSSYESQCHERRDNLINEIM